jgi:hypothetical protein
MASACFEHYLSIFRRRYTNDTVYCMNVLSPGRTRVGVQPTDITRTQYIKYRLCRASWRWASNARNMQRSLILNKLNEKCITLVSLYWCKWIKYYDGVNHLLWWCQPSTNWFYLIWTVSSVVSSVFCNVLWHCTTLCYCFSCVLYCSPFLYCTVPACDIRAATLRFFRAFSSVVRQMPRYNSQRRGTASTSQIRQ